MPRTFPVVPGVPAAGHTSGGFWHPGKIDGCPKCPAARLTPHARIPNSGRRYRFSPIGGNASYRSGANSVVTFVRANGPGPRSDLWWVRFPTGQEREVATRDLLSLN